MTVPPATPFEPLPLRGESITLNTSGKILVLPSGNADILPLFNEWTLTRSAIPTGTHTLTYDTDVDTGLYNIVYPWIALIDAPPVNVSDLSGNSKTGILYGSYKFTSESIIFDGSTGTVRLPINCATYDNITFEIECKSITNRSDRELIRLTSLGTGAYIFIRQTGTKMSALALDHNVSHIIVINDPENDDLQKHIYKVVYVKNGTFSFYKDGNLIGSRPLGFDEFPSPQNIYVASDFNISEFANIEVYNVKISSTVDDQEVILGQYSTKYIASDIDFFLFTHMPKDLIFKKLSNGETELTLYPGNGMIYYGKINYSDIARDTDSDGVPDCFDATKPGSITNFLLGHWWAVDHVPFDTSDGAGMVTSDGYDFYARA